MQRPSFWARVSREEGRDADGGAVSASSSRVWADEPRAEERHREKQVSPMTRLADAEALKGEKLGQHGAALP